MRSRISIVIPTYKRKDYLLNLLNSLKGKIDERVEIIIVEQVENNEKYFLDRAKELGLLIRYFFLDKASTPRAKNIGIKNVKSEFVVFFDDDVLLKTKLDSYLANFSDKKVVGVAGRSLAKGQKEEQKRNDTGRITFFGKFTDAYSSRIPQEISTVIGCNMCWRKDALKELKGFDEQFTGNALREESDLSLRAKKMGYKILFDPSVEVLHVRAESGGARKTEGRLQWYFDFFSNETYFFLKHRPAWSILAILLTRAEWVLRCMFGFGREVSARSIITPIVGVFDGYRKYRRWKDENRG